MNRRLLLQRLLGGSLLVSAGWMLKSIFLPVTEHEKLIWRSWIDHLIPNDETPGALDLGIDHIFWQETEQNIRLFVLVRHGCAWLDKVALNIYKLPFIELNETQANNIITATTQTPFNDIPNRFFRYSHLRAMQLYYTDPRSRIGTVWEQTPQPIGFMDYQQQCTHV
ncbi:MAG: gluconate 2-dehydrogenase subunit 3 family protein [Proteobacteria bacterium]|nr:gluconate 2-dehydrogenase subunit 3 family protein [Pseudomonadota bacterium]